MQLDENLSYTKQLVAIVDKCVKHLHSKDVVSVKVAWRGPVGEEMTREPEITRIHVLGVTYLSCNLLGAFNLSTFEICFCGKVWRGKSISLGSNGKKKLSRKRREGLKAVD